MRRLVPPALCLCLGLLLAASGCSGRVAPALPLGPSGWTGQTGTLENGFAYGRNGYGYAYAYHERGATSAARPADDRGRPATEDGAACTPVF